MREAAGFIVFHGRGADRRFLLLRNARHKTWAFPKGHLEAGEAPIVGARRELAEETGIRNIREIPGFQDRLEYVVPLGRRPGSTSGYLKITHMFLAEAPSDTWQISSEHDAGLWLSPDEVRARLQHDDLRELFDRALVFLAAVDGQD